MYPQCVCVHLKLLSWFASICECVRQKPLMDLFVHGRLIVEESDPDDLYVSNMNKGPEQLARHFTKCTVPTL